MKVLLIDVDSTIPNLALMKISGYHKQKGDQVGFNIGDPYRVYASIVFSKNKWKGNGIKKMYPDAVVDIGGSGYNLSNKLPDTIEHTMPDYDLYNLDHSMGFTTRGCIRNCSFCLVPKKEGGIQFNSDIYEFWNTLHSHIVLLDNNILALPDHFENIADQLLKNHCSVDFNQGLDIRLINADNAELLSKLKVVPHYRFAWDNVKDESKIIKGLEILKENGISQSLFYVLVGFNTTKDEDLYRLNHLKELGQRAYVMRYQENTRGDRWYNDLSAWANQQRFFASVTFDWFRKFRANRNIPYNL